MLPDVGLPIQFPENARDEIFIVDFHGFVKNPSEGIIRTMLRDIDDWIERYPYLETFDGMTQDEIYENTMLMMPHNLLYALSNEKLSAEEIGEDLKIIEQDVILDNSKITTFEFCLYQMLHEKYVKKCYFFKDTEFYDNEINYIKRQYDDVIEKIECVSGGFLSLFEKVNPTTICITDCDLVLDYIPTHYDKDKLDSMMFIVLNTIKNIEYSEENKLFVYRDNYIEKVKQMNDENDFGIASMFNFALNTEELEMEHSENNEESIEEDDDETI